MNPLQIPDGRAPVTTTSSSSSVSRSTSPDNLMVSDSDPDCSSKVDVADDCWDVVIDFVVVTDVASDDIVDTVVGLSISKCSNGSGSG